MAPGHFSTLESFPEWACEKLKDDEDYNVSSFDSLAAIMVTYYSTGCFDAASRLLHGLVRPV